MTAPLVWVLTEVIVTQPLEEAASIGVEADTGRREVTSVMIQVVIMTIPPRPRNIHIIKKRKPTIMQILPLPISVHQEHNKWGTILVIQNMKVR